MAFGQQSGHPARAQVVQRLLALVVEAGHSDFRDARGPLGLSQRQAAGKFTQAEADALIERLETEADATRLAAGAAVGPFPSDEPQPKRAPIPGPAAAPARTRAPLHPQEIALRETLRRIPTEALAAELERRGSVAPDP